MTDPTPKAYIVAALFKLPGAMQGRLTASACLALSPEMAAGHYVARFLQETGTTDPLDGIVVVPLDEEFMRAALRGAAAGEVVNLRQVEPPAESGPQPDHAPGQNIGGSDGGPLPAPLWPPPPGVA